MSAHRPLPAASARFRQRLIAVLSRHTPASRFFYLGADQIVMVCPVCDAPLSVRFHGTAVRATLECQDWCSEAEIAEVLDLEVRA